MTDANLVLGYLDPEYFLGGKMKLNLPLSRTAIEQQIAQPLGISIEEAAWGIHQVANENMANAARVHALERGKDPRRFPMFAFGGGGPVQAYRIASSLGSPRLLAPLGAGVMSTVGFLSAPLAFDFVRSWTTCLDELDWDHAAKLIEEMEQQGELLLARADVSPHDITHEREVDMRYVGQGHEIRVRLGGGVIGHHCGDELKQEFTRVYRQLYERSGPPVALEITNWRVTSSGPKPNVQLQTEQAGDSTELPIKGQRQAFFPEVSGYVETPVLDRYQMNSGMTFAGPAIVEERESTVIIGPGAECHIDDHLNLVVDLPKRLDQETPE